MESTWPEAHRRDGDPQPPQFRAFALPRISIAIQPRGGAERRPSERERVHERRRDNTSATRALRACVRAHEYVHTRARTRDCIYAESHLPRLKSHRGESRGSGALGIAFARAVIPPRCALSLTHPHARPTCPPSSCPCAAVPRPLPRFSVAVHRAAVCRCIVSIFTQGRRRRRSFYHFLVFPTSPPRTPPISRRSRER